MEIYEVEYQILGTLYFFEPFEKIEEEVDAKHNVIKDALRNLIAKKYVSPYHFNETKRRFEQAFLYDSDNLEEYYFSATSKGIDLYGKGPSIDE